MALTFTHFDTYQVVAQRRAQAQAEVTEFLRRRRNVRKAVATARAERQMAPETPAAAPATAEPPAAELAPAPPAATPLRRDWRPHAACRDRDLEPELFFPTKGASSTDVIRICHTCPVQNECLAEALRRGDQHGIWGGTTANQRQSMRSAARAARKET